MILVGPFGVALGVGLGVGAKSGVGEAAGDGEGEEPGEADGVGVGEKFCAKALRGGRTQPAIARSNKQATAVIARTSSALARRNRTTQSDAGSYRAVGHFDLRCFSSNVTIEP
jgi:hypothetical protein